MQNTCVLTSATFTLRTPLDCFEYMGISLALFPQHDQYGLTAKAKNGMVYVEIRKAIYGLPQAAALANKLIKEQLVPKGYFEVPHTPRLWKHVCCPIDIEFTLVVDDFGIKYAGIRHADRIIRGFKSEYEISKDWKGGLYCGINLEWDYDKRALDFSMSGCIKKLLE